MSSYQIPKDRSGALALDTIMIQLYRLGKIDQHEFEAADFSDKTVFFQRHTFKGKNPKRKKVVLEYMHVSWSEPWLATIRFCTTQKIPSKACRLFAKIIDQYSYLVMFQANGSDIFLGPFFSENSVLRSELHSFLYDNASQERTPVETGMGLWDIIRRNGGASALITIWESLFEQIKYQMLLMDPYCFE